MDVEFTETLIQEVKNRPIIYLPRHKDYRDNTKKLHAWKEIQGIMNEEVPALKAKWKNLKDTYKKFKRSRNVGSGLAAQKLHNWAWANHMSFIDPSVPLNDTEMTETNTETTEISIEPPNEDPIYIPVTNSVLHTEESETRPESGVTGTRNAQKIFRRHKKHNLAPTRLRKRSANDGRVEIKCDGTDLLFLGYADTFKKLTKRKQVSVKFNIARILMEAELDDMDIPERSSVSSDTVIKIKREPMS